MLGNVRRNGGQVPCPGEARLGRHQHAGDAIGIAKMTQHVNWRIVRRNDRRHIAGNRRQGEFIRPRAFTSCGQPRLMACSRYARSGREEIRRAMFGPQGADADSKRWPVENDFLVNLWARA